MSYQVLARKYRPRSFAEMVGQEHVLKALINGLDNDRLHHAYLFTGTRGVGKTTVARVLARCLNCEGGITSRPCGSCGACQEIEQGRCVDLIEVDAASRTRVEDTRELLDNVQYAPTRARFKIYLVDEVHMLSTHSFNALLKTLEEPPPHVKFLFATTDPQKFPVTILSRCLQFNLKRLPTELIAGHLEQVLQQEGIDSEIRALQRLARAADGSMRDALSLTDQAIAFGAGTVREDEVRSMLGSIEEDSVYRLLEALAEEDAQALMAAVDAVAQRSPDFSELLAGLLTTLHELSLLQLVPDAMDAAHPDRERLEALAGRLSPEDVQLYYQIALHGRRDLPLAPVPRMGFEMTLLRMLAFRPAEDPGKGGGHETGSRARAGAAVAPAAKPAEPARAGGQGSVASSRMAELRAAVQAAPPARTEPPSQPPGPDPVPASPAVSAEPGGADQQSGVATGDGPADQAPSEAVPPWEELIERMKLGAMTRAVAMHCRWCGMEGDTVRLQLEAAHRHLLNGSMETRIRQALGRVLGRDIRLQVDCVDGEPVADSPAAQADQRRAERQRAAEQAIDGDPHVHALQELFDAEVIPDSIQPAD